MTNDEWKELVAKTMREGASVSSLDIAVRAKACLDGKSRSYVEDAQIFARAVLALLVELRSASLPGCIETETTKQQPRQTFVTEDGRTVLPKHMVEDLSVGSAGRYVWFLKGKERWEAWPEDELEALLRDRNE